MLQCLLPKSYPSLEQNMYKQTQFQLAEIWLADKSTLPSGSKNLRVGLAIMLSLNHQVENQSKTHQPQNAVGGNVLLLSSEGNSKQVSRVCCNTLSGTCLKN